MTKKDSFKVYATVNKETHKELKKSAIDKDILLPVFIQSVLEKFVKLKLAKNETKETFSKQEVDSKI